MPAVTEVSITAVTEEQAIKPVVFIDGVYYDTITCVSITDKSGIESGECVLRMDMVDPAALGSSTLNVQSFNFSFGSRVEVWYGKVLMFIGRLAKRLDSGQQNQVVWTAYDDRWLFQNIPVRGAFVRDLSDDDGIIKWVGRFVARTNPEGSYNCIGALTPFGLLPVFSPFAELGGSYENPTVTFEGPLKDGVLTAWTPRRWLEYLWLIANMDSSKLLKGGQSVIPTTVDKQWRSLTKSSINWKRETVTGLKSVDLADETIDPLDRKMPDMTFQGKSLLLAIQQTLDVFGTHGMTFHASIDKKGTASPIIVFYPREQANLKSNQSDPKKPGGSQDEEFKDQLMIGLQRSGTVQSINTAFDFQLGLDATNLKGSVLVEGDTIIYETEISFTAPGGDSDTLVPAWTEAEEAAFIDGIKGKIPEGATGRKYAKYPNSIGDTSSSSWSLIADGVGGRPLALGSSPEAVKLLRLFFPRVFKSFWIKTDTLSDSVKEGVKDTLKGYTLLSAPRPALSHQMQYALIPALGDTKVSHRARDYLPVRVQVKSSTDLNMGWHDCTNFNGIRVLGNGELFFDGLAEELDGLDDIDKIYEGQLTHGPSINKGEVKMKSVRVNIAFLNDHRVPGYFEIPAGDWHFHNDLRTELGGPPLMYIDSPGSYHEVHQIGSKPGPVNKFFAADSSWSGEERYLPPGSERKDAEYHARRKIQLVSKPLQESIWRLIGIRPSYQVGTWINKISMIKPLPLDSDWPIEAPIESITFDFLNNETIINGLASHLVRT